jgi:hypothetical protein
VTSARRLEIATFRFQDSSSHSRIQTLEGSGSAVFDSAGISGMLAGEYSSTPVFGGTRGPTSACQASQMPFRLTRQP